MKLVGVTGGNPPFNTDLKSPFLAARQNYINLLNQNGALGVLIPNTLDKTIAEKYAAELDGLLLTGGGDINPRCYNNTKDKMTGELNQTIDDIRDQSELLLFHAFFEKKKPIFGICRGSQLINVALGGTLVQHIDSMIPNLSEIHMTPQDKGGWYVKAHKVQISKDSKIQNIIGANEIEVNSTHHQMVGEPGKQIKIVGKSPQGVNEAIEYEGNQFIMGVQWHPEQLSTEDSSKKLITAFIDAN